jgi:hypothetical protein
MSRDYRMPSVLLHSALARGHDILIYRRIEQDDGPSVDEFNTQLDALGEKASWFKAPWLYAEYEPCIPTRHN